jgi:hypothetical protein
MPTTGGTLTGGLAVNSPDGITTTGPLSAAGNGVFGGTVTAGRLVSYEDVDAAGSLNATGNLNVNGNSTVAYNGSFGGNLGVAGTATVGELDSTGNINAAGYIAASGQVTGSSLGSTAGIYAAGNINGGSISSSSTITAAGNISAAGFQGGPGNAAQLGMYGGSAINFRWYTAGTGQVAYRVNETVEKYIGATANVLDTQYASGGGGPTGAVFGGHDFPGTWYYCYVDFTSDERIKLNIAPSEIDALDILKQIPVDQYDIKPEVASVFRALRGMHGREVLASSDHVAIGLVAQKLQALIPEAVYVGPQPGDNALPEDSHNITLPAITPYLIRAVQQLVARVEALEGGK